LTIARFVVRSEPAVRAVSSRSRMPVYVGFEGSLWVDLGLSINLAPIRKDVCAPNLRNIQS
jgi:hypothetical protein